MENTTVAEIIVANKGIRDAFIRIIEQALAKTNGEVSADCEDSGLTVAESAPQ